jgi:hypothetical protein
VESDGDAEAGGERAPVLTIETPMAVHFKSPSPSSRRGSAVAVAHWRAAGFERMAPLVG